MNDDNPTQPLPRFDEAPEPRRRSWRRPALIAGAVIVAAGLTGGSAALAAQTNTPLTLATSAPSADGGSTGPGAATPGTGAATPGSSATPGATPSDAPTGAPADGTAPAAPTAPADGS
ncbi:hypothetical protein RWH43_07235, partial [Microbacterium sp. KSW2-21]|nr:hypothetical protein [Microbacterium sp. KSW2-21]